MNERDDIASGVRDLDDVRQFQMLFPAAEHFVVLAKREVDSEGWKLVKEWISRANLYDRYVLWLVVAIEINETGVVAALEQPSVYITEVERIERTRDDQDGPKWECNFGQLEYDDWKALVELGGDFAALGTDLTFDVPVSQFAAFWRDTRPRTSNAAPDEMALRAPLRFLS